MDIISSGIVTVSPGVSSSGLFIIQEGILEIRNDGLAQEIALADGGKAIVSGGGILYVCSVSSGGTATVLNGALAQDIAVENGGLYLVSSGGTAQKSLVLSGGTQIVYVDAMVADAAVMGGGELRVNSGAYVLSPVVSQGGLLYAGNGALIDRARIAGTAIVNASAAMNSASVLEGGRVSVLSAGYAFEAEVCSGGSLDVSSGGIINSARISEGGGITVSAGGRSYNTAIDGGQVTLTGNALAPDTPGAFADNTVVNSGGTLIVSSGATATKIRENGGQVKFESGADVSFVSNTFSGLVLSGATATVHSGTTATDTVIASGGWLHLSSGGIANAAVANSSGGVIVSSGGTADAVTVHFGGGLAVFSGGTALQIKENGGLVFVDDAGTAAFVSNTFSGVVLDADNWATVHSGTTAADTVITSGGWLAVYSGGIADDTVAQYGGGLAVHSGGTANAVTVEFGGGLSVSGGGTVLRIRENGGIVHIDDAGTATFVSNTFSGIVLDAENDASVHSGTTAADITVDTDGGLYVYSGGKLTGTQTFEAGATVSMYEGAILDFDISELTPEAGAAALVNDLSVIRGTPLYTLTVSGPEPEGVYTLAEGAAGFDGAITVRNTLGESFGVLTVGETVFVGDIACTLNLTDSTLSVTVSVPAPENLVGTKDRVSWDPVGTVGYVVEYSTDGFAHTIEVDTTGNAVDMLDLPAGTYQWRVKADAGKQWAVGDEIDSDNEPGAPKVLQSNADGSDDLFFATPAGTWGEEGSLALALHVGSVNDWTGTREIVSADGKGRIQNFFFGSADPNVLCLTDWDNGDAIFVDDVYTGLPEDVKEDTARLYRIREVRAGAGDDIVDMTSQRFEYVGEGMTIRGGDGDDTIWANKGNNFLFGDAGDDRIVGASKNDVVAGGIGNDRMHGGGGDDVFTFCDNWGTDEVEQLETGKVTLWFVSGDIGNWDAASLTYTDGENSVVVKGVAADGITLKFGGNGTEADAERFAALSDMGAFSAFTSQGIFGTGTLASL